MIYLLVLYQDHVYTDNFIICTLKKILALYYTIHLKRTVKSFMWKMLVSRGRAGIHVIWLLSHRGQGAECWLLQRKVSEGLLAGSSLHYLPLRIFSVKLMLNSS